MIFHDYMSFSPPRARWLRAVTLALLATLSPLVAAQVIDPIFSGDFQIVVPPPASQAITLTANADLGAVELVSMGIPFAPGALTDANQVRILDAGGIEVPAFVKPTLRWHWLDNSIRAVKVQFFADPAGQYRFDTSQPRTRIIDEQFYDNGTRPGKMNAPVPRLLATLDAGWLVDSQIAGPQLVRDPARAYDQFVDRQWQWAENTSYTGVHGFLFDRASVIGFQYVRNGDPDYFAEFYNSATFYLSKIKTEGSGGGWPDCTGGWAFDGVNACDPKYSYLTPQLLLIALAGDDTRLSDETIGHMVENQMLGGWNFPLGPYQGGAQSWTERQIGLALEHVVSGYELTGDAGMRQDILAIVGWLHDHQQTPPGDPYTGGWTHSWQMHEGLDYDPTTDVRGTSPWMSANIAGGLWRAWQVTGDTRIGVLLSHLGRYLENHGFATAAQLAENDWRSSCNADGTISFYFSSALAPESAVLDIQNDQGWGADSHNPELLMVMAAARYFETDPAWRTAFSQRATLLARYLNTTCAASANTARAFNWQHRNPEAVWLLAQ
jgi:hypothetical protein